MKLLRPFSSLFALIVTGYVGNMNPTGGNSAPNYPYFITTEPLIVKKSSSSNRIKVGLRRAVF
ncbi:hypothetical protein D3C85_393680 [compost metagenome]